MRFVLNLLAAIAVALVVGFGLSWFSLTGDRWVGMLTVGPWQARPAIGASAPDPYARALLSRAGALQLGLSEGLQFVATTDSAGLPLDRACRYRLEGPTPLATFWTLVALDPQGVNIARPGAQLALNSARLVRMSDGIPVIYVSPWLSPYNWLEITGQGPFTLALSLYDVASLGGGTELEALPAITRESCL